MNAFAALADPTRAEIVDALAERGRTVNEIVGLFSLTQPSISRHLRILREAGLVSVEPDGQRRVYRLDPAPLREIDHWLDRYRKFWAGKLDDLERHMDEKSPT
jgi:DNA-binding transcriptional ArsR family regulator